MSVLFTVIGSLFSLQDTSESPRKTDPIHSSFQHKTVDHTSVILFGINGTFMFDQEWSCQ